MEPQRRDFGHSAGAHSPNGSVTSIRVSDHRGPVFECLESRLLLDGAYAPSSELLSLTAGSPTFGDHEVTARTWDAGADWRSNLYDMGDSYRAGGRDIPLLRVGGEIVLHVSAGSETTFQAAMLANGGRVAGREVSYRLRGSTAMLTLDASGGATIDQGGNELVLEEARKIPGVSWAEPVFLEPETGFRMVMGNELNIRVQDGVSIEDVIGPEVLGYSRLFGTTHTFTLDMPFAGADILEAAATYARDPRVVWASPNSHSEASLCEVDLHDDLFGQQWHLDSASEPNTDVDAMGAWKIVIPDPDIVIAVIDTGVDIGHPDLHMWTNPGEVPGDGIDNDGNGYVDDISGWNFRTGTYLPGPVDPLPPDPADPNTNHGTAVAGVIAERGDNTIGGRGISFDSQIMSLNIYDATQVFPFATPAGMAAAVRYAAGINAAGVATWASADVLNISMGWIPDDATTDALNDAALNGRFGNGLPIFVSTGNSATAYSNFSVTGITPGTWIAEWRYSKDASGSGGSDTVWIADVHLPDDTVERFDSSSLPQGWSTNGDAQWIIEDDPAHAYGTGRYQARAGAIQDNEITRLRSRTITVTTTGELTYRAWVSSQDGDTLALYLSPNGGQTWWGPYLSRSGVPTGLSTSIGYPASLPSTIAVGASTDCGYRADYSCFGSALDFVAPSGGGDEGITTTDRVGTAGYNGATTANGGDYTDDFSGTSSASPLAAGIAALMLSRYPFLTGAQIRAIMRDTAQKIGDVAYVDGRNQYYGYGMVNAESALKWIAQAAWHSDDESLDLGSPAKNDYLGYSVDMDGEWAIIGAYNRATDGLSGSGAAYVYHWDGGDWVYYAELEAGTPSKSACFGWSVAIDGTRAVVGARGDSTGPTGEGPTMGQSGAAYVYELSGGAWLCVRKLTPSDRAAKDWFGHAVGVSGETIVVSALGDGLASDKSGGDKSGSVYVFVKDAEDGWDVSPTKIRPSDVAKGDGFGYSVCIDGDTIAVGSYMDDDNQLKDSGSVYVFNRSGAEWPRTAKLFAREPSKGAKFGSSLALQGDLLVVGAPEASQSWVNTKNGKSAALKKAGAAYVFEKDTTWTQVAALGVDAPAANDFFGSSVSIDDGRAAVGAPGRGPITIAANGKPNKPKGSKDWGAVYTFSPEGSEWECEAMLEALSGQQGGKFGTAVAIGPTNLLVGAPYHKQSTYANAGRAYALVDGLAPIVSGLEATTTAGTVLQGEVLGYEADGSVPSFSLVSGAASGATVVLNTDGSFTYTPVTDFVGTDMFTVVAQDGNGVYSNIARVTITVTSPNLDPEATDDSANTNVDLPVTIAVLTNDSDPDSDDVLTIVSVTQPTYGTVTHDGTVVTYTPDGQHTGNYSFSYTVSDEDEGTDTGTVTVTVNAQGTNLLPDGVEDYATTTVNTAVTIGVLANDTDRDDDSLSVSGITQGSNGTVANNTDDVTYTPDTDWDGEDSFTYTVSDGNGGTDTVTVYVNVILGETVTYQAEEAVLSGVQIDTAHSDYNGTGYAKFLNTTYDYLEWTVSVDSPGAYLLEWRYSLVSGDRPVEVGVNGDAVGEQPEFPATGDGSMWGVASTSAMLEAGENTIRVTDIGFGGPNIDELRVLGAGSAGNRSPLPQNDTASATMNTAQDIYVLTNDSDLDAGDSLTVDSVGDPLHGSAEVSQDTLYVTYTPPTDWVGQDMFEYTVGDGKGAFGTAVVLVTVDVDSTDLVAYWTMDERSGTTAEDSAPNGTEEDDGSLEYDAAFASGHINGYVTFDGAGDHIAISDSDDINLGQHSLRTVTAWFNVNDKTITANKQTIYEEGGSADGLNIYVYGGSLYVGAWPNGCWLSTSQISSGQWHHVAIVLDGGESTLQGYLDGEEFNSGAGATLANHGDNIGIGKVRESTRFHTGSATGAHPFAGLVDDVRVYNRVLDSTEIDALANAEVFPTVTISATDDAADEEGQDTATFTFTRTGTSGELEVNYVLAGTVVDNDYEESLYGAVTIEDGQSSATLTVTPADDMADENVESVALELAPGHGYYVYNSLTASAAVSDNDGVDEADLVAHWRFDEGSGTTAGDTAPFGTVDDEGALEGDTHWEVGKINAALEFDGLGDRVVFSTSDDVDKGTHDARSVLAWFKVDNKGISARKQVIYDEGGMEDGVNIYVYDGSLYVGNWAGGSWLSTDEIVSGQWHHVALVLNGTGQTFMGYLDGVRFGSGTGSTLAGHSNPFAIGGLTGRTKFHDSTTPLGGHEFDGMIDDVRVYNRVVAPAEIAMVAGAEVLDFDEYCFSDYGEEGGDGVPVIVDDGQTIRLVGDVWSKVEINYTVTANTVMEFDFQSGEEGDTHGIGFDNDDTISSDKSFQLFGTDTWGIQTHNDYSGSGWKHYTINVGQSFTGEMDYLTFTNDHDVTPPLTPTGESLFRNVLIYESA